MCDEIPEAVAKKWKRMPKWAKNALRDIDGDYKKLDMKKPKKDRRDRGGRFDNWHIIILKLYLKKKAVTQHEMVATAEAEGCPNVPKTLRQYGTHLERWGYIQKVEGRKAPNDKGHLTRVLWELTPFGKNYMQKQFNRKPK